MSLLGLPPMFPESRGRWRTGSVVEILGLRKSIDSREGGADQIQIRFLLESGHALVVPLPLSDAGKLVRLIEELSQT